MRYQTIGDLRDFVSVKVRNDEASATISKGAPVVLRLDTVEDGLAVVLPGTLPANVSTLLFGVAMDDLSTGELGEAQVFGFNRYTLLVRATRANSTDSWASAGSSALGIPLAGVTINFFSGSGGTVGSAFTMPPVVLAETLASYASSASNTSDTRTAIVVGVKTFIRML
jgi:hypothetical protein